ncbi:MAG: pyridoxal-phosphate dependent enzyme [Moraxellaceae bacterium]|nr:pyridoxal-phosphate dependent enzyme [Moraxellaceae bacterium]
MPALQFPEFSQPTRLQLLQGPQWRALGAPVWIKREDERDGLLGGNKWCKLMGHLQAARAAGYTQLLSAGGAWSNHLHALAVAGARYGFSTTGLVRGNPCQTPMIADAIAAGMEIRFVPRESYRERHHADWLQRLTDLPQAWWIPEGGAGPEADVGLQQLAAELEAQTDGDVLLAVPVGTGTTFAGLVKALPPRFSVWGFQVFHDANLCKRLTPVLASARAGWQLWPTVSMRQHRTLSPELSAISEQLQAEEGMRLDTVYGVRLMAVLPQRLAQHYCLPATVVILHTGGLQGLRGHQFLRAA